MDRPIYSNYDRDLSPEIARIAVFIIQIGPLEDSRPEHEKSVSGCESGACLLRETNEQG
jgi:hypothetical protein